MKKKVEDHVLEAMRKDLGYWHGPFYVNRKDPRLLVPKYNEMWGRPSILAIRPPGPSWSGWLLLLRLLACSNRLQSLHP